MSKLWHDFTALPDTYLIALAVALAVAGALVYLVTRPQRRPRG